MTISKLWLFEDPELDISAEDESWDIFCKSLDKAFDEQRYNIKVLIKIMLLRDKIAIYRNILNDNHRRFPKYQVRIYRNIISKSFKAINKLIEEL